jgi:hypothetical protein
MIRMGNERSNMKLAWCLEIANGRTCVVDADSKEVLAEVKSVGEGPLMAMAPSLRGCLSRVVSEFERAVVPTAEQRRVIEDAKAVLAASHHKRGYFKRELDDIIDVAHGRCLARAANADESYDTRNIFARAGNLLQSVSAAVRAGHGVIDLRLAVEDDYAQRAAVRQLKDTFAKLEECGLTIISESSVGVDGDASKHEDELGRAADDARVDEAVFAFWGEIAQAFPEVTTGDSQLSGETEAAISTWLVGDPGDRPVQKPGWELSIPDSVDDERVRKAVEKGIDAVRAFWVQSKPESAVGAPTPEVIAQLDSCVRHVLHWNLPPDESVEAADHSPSP